MTNPPSPHAVAARFGAERHGLICAFLFAPGCAPQPLDDAALALAGIDAPGECFAWIHLNLAHAGAQGWIADHLEDGDSFVEVLRDGSRATRVQRDGNALVAVINDVAFDHAFEATDISTLWLHAGPRLVVTARSRPLRSVDRLRMAVRRGESVDSTAGLLQHLLDDQADELQQIVRQAADRVDAIEDHLLAGDHEGHAPELARLRRFMVRLQRVLAPEPGALIRTLARPPAWMRAQDVEALQRAHDDFAHVLRDVASLQERTKLMQDEAAARVAEENNRSLFVLTMVTVLALPINLVSGMMGMNVGGIPFAEHPQGFWLMVTLITCLTGTIVAIAMVRLRSNGRR